jgi:hypothetical protein
MRMWIEMVKKSPGIHIQTENVGVPVALYDHFLQFLIIIIIFFCIYNHLLGKM